MKNRIQPSMAQLIMDRCTILNTVFVRLSYVITSINSFVYDHTENIFYFILCLCLYQYFISGVLYFVSIVIFHFYENHTSDNSTYYR